METIKSVGVSLKNSPIGAILGGVGAFYAAKKFGKVENKVGLLAIAIAGAVIGATIEYKIKAKATKPALAAKK